MAWASAPLRGTRLDHLTGGTMIVDLHGQRHLPTVLVAAALAPTEAARMRFHALWT